MAQRAIGLVAAALALLLGVGLAGCGGGSDEPTSSDRAFAAAASERVAKSDYSLSGPYYFYPGTGYVAQPRDIYVPFDAGGLIIGEHYSVTIAYWAQTFTAAGRTPTTLTIPMFNNLAASPFRFRVLLVEALGGAGQFTPGAVLWESSDAAIPEIPAPDPTEITFKVKGVRLTAGSRYAWVVDSYSTRDGVMDVGLLMANIGNTAPPYAAGEAYWQAASGQGRTADFAASWTPWDASGDASFLLRFTR
jgi:hypothetical protein